MQAIDAARRRSPAPDRRRAAGARGLRGQAGSPPVTSHSANVAGEPVPVGDSESAKDATFGYTSSNLREFVAGSDGTIAADQVHSISLTDIREGGPDRVAEVLGWVTGGAFVVVNATDYADLEIVVLGGSRPRSGQVVRLPLWSVVPPCSPARTASHSPGADLADRFVPAARGSLSSVRMLA